MASLASHSMGAQKMSNAKMLTMDEQRQHEQVSEAVSHQLQGLESLLINVGPEASAQISSMLSRTLTGTAPKSGSELQQSGSDQIKVKVSMIPSQLSKPKESVSETVTIMLFESAINVSKGENEGLSTASMTAAAGSSKSSSLSTVIAIPTVAAKNQKKTNTKKRFVRIINTLNYDEKRMEVSNDMTINDMMDLYEAYNVNCRNYVWKDIWGHEMKLDKTLDENGFIDVSDITDETGLDHFPTFLLYFKDGFENEPLMDLDVAPPPLDLPYRNY